MRKRFTVGILVTAVAASLLAASAASAAVEFGDSCTGDGVAPPEEGGYTLTMLAAPAGALPLTAPSAGVITKVKLSVAESLPFALPTNVRVLRSAGGNNYTVVSQVTVPIVSGQTVADARLPVQAGDRLGLRGQPFTYEGSDVPSLSFYCKEGGEGASLGAAKGDVPPGSTAEFNSVGKGGVPIVATLEPDADHDGFGDETQDKCPQNAAFQIPCPAPVALSASSVAKKGLVTVLITSNVQAPVTVAGTVRLGKGKTATLNGGTQIVAPGALAKFTLLFPKALRSKLKEVQPKRSLSLNLTASTPNQIGPPTVAALAKKLKGQAAPEPKRPGKPKTQA
jgi:hypothetical protein